MIKISVNEAAILQEISLRNLPGSVSGPVYGMYVHAYLRMYACSYTHIKLIFIISITFLICYMLATCMLVRPVDVIYFDDL